MFKVEGVSITKTVQSQFVKPFSIDYTLNGFKKRWDLIETHNSVSVIIYNSTRKVFVFVKQFRPGVYYNSIPAEDRKNPVDTEKYPSSLGITIELCAGIVDKDKPLEEIAKEEVLEECGYDVPLSNLKKVKSYRGAVGFAGECQTMFYAEVTDDMKVSKGGGLVEEGEVIEVVELTIPETKKLLDEEVFNSPPEFLYALMWIFRYVLTGGGLVAEGEVIEVLELTVAQAKELLLEEPVLNVPPGFLWGLSWFFLTVQPSLST